MNEARHRNQSRRLSPVRFAVAVLFFLFALALGFLSGGLGLSRPASMLVGGAFAAVCVALLLICTPKNVFRRYAGEHEKQYASSNGVAHSQPGGSPRAWLVPVLLLVGGALLLAIGTIGMN